MWAARPVAVIAIAAIAAASNTAHADEGGISFWLPGTFGSLAAAPQQPGWSTAVTYTTRRFLPEAMWRERAKSRSQLSCQRYC
jgi:hypothetical protein